MDDLVAQLTKYAAYHRDPRNIATHFVGIPLIVLAVQVLLALPHWMAGDVALSPMLAVSLAAVLWYLRLDLRLGLAMAVQLGLGAWLAMHLVADPLAGAAWWGGLLFVVGWIIQFIGHLYEGRKPAFVDDLIGLAVGPLFVMAEAAFLLGWRHALRNAIEARAGPVQRRARTARGGQASS